MVKVKICGITNQADADAAVDAGADALGFVFVRSSPRFVRISTVRAIAGSLPPFVTAVGVFVNAPRRDINEVVSASGIGAVQFHGEETPADIEGYRVPVFKAFRVGAGFDPSLLSRYRPGVFLLDTFSDDAPGGTGKTFNWDVALEAKKYGRIVLSGGLTPDNVGSAVRKVAPYAIDVSSGVETSPGVKDKNRIQQLFSALRKTEESLCSY